MRLWKRNGEMRMSGHRQSLQAFRRNEKDDFSENLIFLALEGKDAEKVLNG